MALPMPPVKPDSALVFAAAIAASIAVAAASGGAPSLEDVQIGEKGRILRVALICSTRCEIAPDQAEAFRILGVDADLDVDLSARSALASRLTIVSAGAGSVLKIDAKARIDAAKIIDCRSDSGPAPCVEFRFAEKAAAPPAGAPAPPELRSGNEDAAGLSEKKDLPFIGTLTLAPRPVLRDAPGLPQLPQFAPPERLAPPSGAAGDMPAALVGRPSFIAVDRAEALGERPGFDFKAEAGEILGKSFSVGACEGARARLLSDAWALQAMIDAAFCKAADGALEEADADFARLLAYTPDNYEALVGRGLIAIAAGERARGHRLLQDALNALPPIAESDRIVAAMERN